MQVLQRQGSQLACPLSAAAPPAVELRTESADTQHAALWCPWKQGLGAGSLRRQKLGKGPSGRLLLVIVTHTIKAKLAWKSVSVCSTTSSQLPNTLRLVAILLQGGNRNSSET